MPLADINGTTIHYAVAGTGPRALVLHGGLGFDQTGYRALDRLASRLELVYADHRGNGRSGRPPLDTITMEQLADDALALADALGPAEELVVIGHSYGGFVAQELAIRHRERLTALILVSTTPGQLGAGEHPAPDGPPVAAEWVEMVENLPTTDAELEASVAGAFTAFLHRADTVDLSAEMSGTVYSAAAMARGFEVLAGWSSVDRLGAVDVPTLLLVGRHDAMTAVPQSERIAGRLPDAELVVFEESAHFPWLEEPEQFFSTVEGWLDRRL